MKELVVKEIFYSLQGEGAQFGLPMIFIRLEGCNLTCSYCDTDFTQGQRMPLEAIYKEIESYPSQNILWTGGEPTLQLTDEVVSYFSSLGYRQSIETNGTKKVPTGIDYITCSPKPEALLSLNKIFPQGVNELRFPFGYDAPLPPSLEQLPKAENYFLSPIYSPQEVIINPPATLEDCIDYIKKNPQWRLSVQMHKLLGIE